MNDIAEKLFTRINNQIQVTRRDEIIVDVRLYHGAASRTASRDMSNDTKYPYITYLAADEYPIIFHNGSENEDEFNPPIVETYWNFTIWSDDAKDIGTIHEGLVDIFNENDIEGVVGTIRSQGMPMMIDDNEPENLVYSRSIECRIYVED